MWKLYDNFHILCQDIFQQLCAFSATSKFSNSALSFMLHIYPHP